MHPKRSQSETSRTGSLLDCKRASTPTNVGLGSKANTRLWSAGSIRPQPFSIELPSAGLHRPGQLSVLTAFQRLPRSNLPKTRASSPSIGYHARRQSDDISGRFRGEFGEDHDDDDCLSPMLCVDSGSLSPVSWASVRPGSSDFSRPLTSMQATYSDPVDLRPPLPSPKPPLRQRPSTAMATTGGGSGLMPADQEQEPASPPPRNSVKRVTFAKDAKQPKPSSMIAILALLPES